MTTPGHAAALLSYSDLPWPVTGSLTSADTKFLVQSGAGLLTGYTVRETSGTAAAAVRIRDGRDATGELLATIALAAGGSAGLAMALPGWPFRIGLYVEAVSGAWEASLTYIIMPGGL